jgi:competence protein ComEC
LENVRVKTIINSPSKTLASALAVFCFGILLGPLIPSGWWEVLLISSICLIVVGSMVRGKTIRFALVLLGIFLFALFRYTQVALPSNILTVADAPSSQIRVSGTVDGEVEQRLGGQRIVLDDVALADKSRSGRILVWAPLYPEINYGDELVFNCKVEAPEPFEGFAYDRFLESQGILALCYRPEYIDVRSSESFSLIGSILSFKQASIDRLGLIVPEPHASFLSGLIFGGSSSLSHEMKEDFSSTGTSHILAASGFNVSLFSLVFLGWILSTRLGRKKGLILSTILIVVYVIIAGATPAVVRAGLMGGVVVLAHGVNRKSSLLNVMLATAALMLLINPLILMADVGFQLSFAATAAVLGLTKPLEKYLQFIPKTFELRTSFAASLSAIIITLPILLWHFGQLSIIAPLANLLVLPLVVYAMGITIIALVISVVFVPLGTIVAFPAWALSFVMLWLISVLGSISFATLELAHARLLAIVVASILFFLWFHFSYARRT